MRNPFLASAASIIRAIRGTLQRISQGRKTPGGWLGPKSLTASAGSAVSGLAPRVVNQFVGTLKQPVYHSSGRVSYEQPRVVEAGVPVSGAQLSAARAQGVEIPISGFGKVIRQARRVSEAGISTPSPRATRAATVIPKQVVKPARHAPSVSNIAAKVGRTQAQVSGTAGGLSRTQAPIPSPARKAAGITPPPPVSRTKSVVPSSTTAIEAPAIRAHRAARRGGPVAAIPVPPAVERAPLAVTPRRVRVSVPKSAILRELKKARKGKPGYLLLPETRPLEARPRIIIPVT